MQKKTAAGQLGNTIDSKKAEKLIHTEDAQKLTMKESHDHIIGKWDPLLQLVCTIQTVIKNPQRESRLKCYLKKPVRLDKPLQTTSIIYNLSK